MKAKIRVTNRNRILSTVGLLILGVTIGYSQGLLAESAIKLFKINKPVVEVNVPEFTFVSCTDEQSIEDSFRLKNYIRDSMESELEYESNDDQLVTVHISKTFYVSAIEISYESEIETEEWMTIPLSNNLESELIAEAWMSELLSESVEEEIAVEDWMTELLTASLESELNTEDWMTESFSESVESEIVTEEWMTESFTAYNEEQLSVENWMTESFPTK